MEDRYIIHWVGWDNSFTKGTQHDKVWGWLEMRDGRIYNFWGARGKTLRFKSHHSKSSVISVQRVKERPSRSEPAHVRLGCFCRTPPADTLVRFSSFAQHSQQRSQFGIRRYSEKSSRLQWIICQGQDALW